MTPITVLQGIMDRLDQTTSDPQWLNEELATLKTLLEAPGDYEAAPAPDTTRTLRIRVSKYIPHDVNMVALGIYNRLMADPSLSGMPHETAEWSFNAAQIFVDTAKARAAAQASEAPQ